jgi:hypothetical protein
MADTTLSFNVLARDNASRTVTKIGQRFDGLHTSVGKASAGMKAVPWLAAAAGAVVVGKSLIKMAESAAQDEAAQKRLAVQLQNSAHASAAQIAQTEDYITKAGRAKGVTDDELRPALGNLVRATHDVGKAQQLANLAMDVSAGTGKDLGTVSLALAKAQNGNVGALGRLGIATKDADGKTLSFQQITQKLATTFKGQATAHANTFAGKMERLKLTFDETKESIGAKLLPYAEKFSDWLLNEGIPALERFGGWLDDNKFKFAAVFVGISQAVVKMAKFVLPIVKTIDGAFRDFLGGMLHSAAKAFGWIPEIGPKLKAADEGFKNYSMTVDKAFDGAIDKANEWDKALAKTAKEIRLKANIQDLQSKIKTARAELSRRDLTKERRATLTASIKKLQQGVNDAQAKVNSLHGKTVTIDLKFTSAGVNLSAPSSVGRRALGGAIRGPGSGTSDQAGLFALSNNEWVIRAKASQKYGEKAMASINAGTAAVIPMADGGQVSWPSFDGRYNAATNRGARQFGGMFGPYGRALSWAKSQDPKHYQWGGVGNPGWDCSGFMSGITNVILGRSPNSRLFATGSFPTGMFSRGMGLFSIGSRRGNPGHMAGTLLGVNVESRGGDGVVIGSGARGARNGLFGGNVWHLGRLAGGGRAGDAPFDLLDPRGRNFLGGDVLQALSRGVLNRDRGGPVPPGWLAYNGTNRTETMGFARGDVHIHLHGTEQQLMNQLTKRLNDLHRGARL